jgi:hypothetical protein
MKKTFGRSYSKDPIIWLLGGLYGVYFLFILIHVALQASPHICGLDDGYTCGYWLKVWDLTAYLIPFTLYITVPFLALVLLLRSLISFLRKRF